MQQTKPHNTKSNLTQKTRLVARKAEDIERTRHESAILVRKRAHTELHQGEGGCRLSGSFEALLGQIESVTEPDMEYQ